MFSAQLWFCNGCGREMHSPPGSALGREFRCCSPECVKEMNWRHTLSILGKEYKLDPEGPLARAAALLDAPQSPPAQLNSEEESNR